MTADRSSARETHSPILAILAAALFVPLFIFRSTGPLDFWTSFSLSVVFLSALALGVDRGYFGYLREDVRVRPMIKVGLGVLSALVLYLVFLGGNSVVRSFYPGAPHSIGGIYALGNGVSRVRIVLLLLFFIGPGEELFWRGYLQRAWQSRFSPTMGWLLTSLLYAAVHAGSGNPVLVLAAAVCGLFWGALFLRFRSPLMLCVSHALWDILVFIVLPFS